MTKMGARLKELRNRSNLTQMQLAEKLGVANDTVSRWERGVLLISRESLMSIAAIFNTTISYLLGEIDDSSPPIKVMENWEGAETSAKIPEKQQRQNPDPRSEVVSELISDPRKFAAAALIAGMNDDQLRKAYDFLSDQKQLAELKKLKEA
jgi:transcriptional regulator with XRE-family HTH domain